MGFDISLLRASRIAWAAPVLCILLVGCTDSESDTVECLRPAQLGVNLVSNGDAELGPAGDGGPLDDGAPVEPQCWQRTDGCFTAMTYSEAYGGFGDARPDGAGDNLFGGGRPCDAGAELSGGEQVIDQNVLAAIRSDIATGTLGYSLSADLGGYEDQEDNARVEVTFLDVSGNDLATIQVGPVDAEDRNDEIAFVNRSVTGAVPEETTSIEVHVILDRTEGSNNDAVADNIELVLE